MVVIRMSRVGRRNLPVYTLVAADSRRPRDGKFLEKLGQYLPKAKEGKELVDVNVESVQKWLKSGAQLSDTVRTLFKRNNITLA
ncbi:MAG: 30S ribosomal protein S16 [Bacteriovoracaceae bacterium]|nr:30S ribosomal protein S16 [Bacteriovoracaceae bacterium]